MLRTIAFIILITTPLSSIALDEQIADQLIWDFSGFVNAFEAKDWKEAEKYIVDSSKFGFGGEHGFDGFRSIYTSNERCYSSMLFSLKQGCKKADNGDSMQCVSPPQYTDPKVIYLGARAAFSYSEKHKKWVVDYFICGGD